MGAFLNSINTHHKVQRKNWGISPQIDVLCARPMKKLKSIFSLTAQWLVGSAFGWHTILLSNIISLLHDCFDVHPFKAEAILISINLIKAFLWTFKLERNYRSFLEGERVFIVLWEYIAVMVPSWCRLTKQCCNQEFIPVRYFLNPGLRFYSLHFMVPIVPYH